MRRVLCPMLALGVMLCIAAIADGQKPVYTVEKIMRYGLTASGHTIEIAIHQGQINTKSHRLSGGYHHEDKSKDKPATIDGIEIAGTDSDLPKMDPVGVGYTTITKIDLKWDGKTVQVAPRHYINLFDLHLDTSSIQVIPSEEGDAVLIQGLGGDGGGSYLVSLVLRKNGKHRQYEAGYCESGLRPYPYAIYFDGRDKEDGMDHLSSFNWRKSKPVQDRGGKR